MKPQLLGCSLSKRLAIKGFNGLPIKLWMPREETLKVFYHLKDEVTLSNAPGIKFVKLSDTGPDSIRYPIADLGLSNAYL